MDGGAWKAAVHGVAEGRTRLSIKAMELMVRQGLELGPVSGLDEVSILVYNDLAL